MPVRKEHHSSHLDDPEAKAQFARTAPIETKGYWDLVDELQRREDIRPDQIKARRESVEVEIVERAVPERDAVQTQDMRRIMGQQIGVLIGDKIGVAKD